MTFRTAGGDGALSIFVWGDTAPEGWRTRLRATVDGCVGEASVAAATPDELHRRVEEFLAALGEGRLPTWPVTSQCRRRDPEVTAPRRRRDTGETPVGRGCRSARPTTDGSHGCQ